MLWSKTFVYFFCNQSLRPINQKSFICEFLNCQILIMNLIEFEIQFLQNLYRWGLRNWRPKMFTNFQFYCDFLSKMFLNLKHIRSNLWRPGLVKRCAKIRILSNILVPQLIRPHISAFDATLSENLWQILGSASQKSNLIWY